MSEREGERGRQRKRVIENASLYECGWTCFLNMGTQTPHDEQTYIKNKEIKNKAEEQCVSENFHVMHTINAAKLRTKCSFTSYCISITYVKHICTEFHS